jgi:hypothetical protein
MKNNTIITQKNTPKTLASGRGIKCESKNNKESNHAQNFNPKQLTKQQKVISEFLKNKKLSCLDHYWLGDTCLHSTVSTLSKRYGLEIPRKRQKLPNRQGKKVSIVLYWFSETDKQKATKILGGDYE